LNSFPSLFKGRAGEGFFHLLLERLRAEDDNRLKAIVLIFKDSTITSSINSFH
jgi:hypothetical protein